MSEDKKLLLISLLLELSQDERTYNETYRMAEEKLESTEDKYERYNFYSNNNRIPNNATIKDCMRLIGRLSYRVASGKL